MNWDAIGAIGEIVGAIAVVITLVYLAAQIRSNTRTTTANASFQATHSWAEVTHSLAQLPNDQFGAIMKMLKADTAGTDLTPEEYERIRYTLRNIFQRLEGQYYLYKYGLLEPAVWDVRSAIGRGLVDANPMLREWWANETDPLNYSQEFVDAINRSQKIDASELSRPPVG